MPPYLFIQQQKLIRFPKYSVLSEYLMMVKFRNSVVPSVIYHPSKPFELANISVTIIVLLS
jgi:hypothetical protein